MTLSAARALAAAEIVDAALFDALDDSARETLVALAHAGSYALSKPSKRTRR
jgi:hypothetical protein